MLQYTGYLKSKGEETAVTDKFRKREFVLTDAAASYPNFVLFQLSQDRCGIIDNIAIGQQLTVSFNLKGREWRSPEGDLKTFNILDAYRVDQHTNRIIIGTESTSSTKPQSSSMPPAQQKPKDELIPTPDDDLPF